MQIPGVAHGAVRCVAAGSMTSTGSSMQTNLPHAAGISLCGHQGTTACRQGQAALPVASRSGRSTLCELDGRCPDPRTLRCLKMARLPSSVAGRSKKVDRMAVGAPALEEALQQRDFAAAQAIVAFTPGLAKDSLEQWRAWLLLHAGRAEEALEAYAAAAAAAEAGGGVSKRFDLHRAACLFQLLKYHQAQELANQVMLSNISTARRSF